MEFTVVIKADVEPADEDVMTIFGDAVESRFAGTAVHIQSITVTKEI
jgi:hypothetical protein